MSNIAILGNFSVNFCTESELAWTLQNMGHTVVRLQENSISTDEVVSTCRERAVKLLIYVHTHGWDTVGRITLDQMLDQLRKSGIKTCSFHLDRFWGLNLLDQREDRIGTHAFWRTDTVFTADGGNDEKFKARGINHIWMPPAVVERDCYFGTPSLQFNSPVAFTGAEGYHPEYPFRPRLVGRLREKYATNFRSYTGIREKALNDLYASVRVLVGDSCFAGSDRYWSDRVPETIGRGGFLIYPGTPGLDIPGLVTYEAGNIDDLISKIDYWIDDDRNAERISRRNQSHAFVKEFHTYTNRMQTLLQVMGIK
jgi:Glycosyl transferases group 1